MIVDFANFVSCLELGILVTKPSMNYKLMKNSMSTSFDKKFYKAAVHETMTFMKE